MRYRDTQSPRQKAGLAIAAKLRAKDPDHYKKLGAIGGKLSRTGGFYADRELARRAGRIGGTISRRRPPFMPDNSEFGDGLLEPSWKDKLKNKLRSK